jgi:hypothetical protein
LLCVPDDGGDRIVDFMPGPGRELSQRTQLLFVNLPVCVGRIDRGHGVYEFASFIRDLKDIPESRHMPPLSGMSGGERAPAA